MTRSLSTNVFSSVIIAGLLISVITGQSYAADPASTPVLNANQQAFFDKVKSMCGARFEGDSVFPEDPGDAFRGQLLVATVETCGDDEIRIPFLVGPDSSRTWVLGRTVNGLQLKHDHRHADGTPDEVTLYGGVAVDAGSALSKSFPADSYTADLIPEASTNEWFLTFSADGQELTYYLERHGKPRYKAVLNKRPVEEK
ncbi:MAG: hypothetical protein WBN41_00420 [Lysobacterales bacterium]